MKIKNFFTGTDQEAAHAIISHYMSSGEENKFIATIPKKRIPAILEKVKNQNEYVYENIKENMKIK